MTSMTYRILKTSRFKNLYSWSVLNATPAELNFSDKYNRVKIGSLLRKSKNSILINDDKIYKRVTVKLYGGGVKVRDEVLGKEIKTKRQFVLKEGQFLYSRIDARNGAFGLAGKEVDNAIVSNEFPIYDVDTSLVIPEFLVLITSSKPFYDFCQSLSSGSTGRQRIDESSFLSFKVPLPDISIQTRIVEQHKHNITTAQEAENEANELEKQIENYLFSELGIEKPKTVEKKEGLQFVRFKDLSRWDYGYVMGDERDVFAVLKEAKYPILALGQTYKFINRPWSNKKHKNNTFRYVEIGSVDSTLGITDYSEIEIEKAPSRATQTIKENDLIIGLTRPNLRKFALVSNKYNDYVCSSGFQIISPSDGYNLVFLLEFLKSEVGIKQISFFMAGAIYPAITSKQLKNLQIPLPPKPIQDRIAKHITAIKEKIKSLRQKAEDLRKQAKETFENEIFA